MIRAWKHSGWILFLSLVAVFSFCGKLTAQPADSLDRMLNAYLQVLEYESLEVKKSESDFLISTCSDPKVRQKVALKLYDHWLQSPLMGVEEVAIHLYDRWFRTGEVEVPESLAFGARIFAEFNRSSLLGCPAPELRLCTPDGDSLDVFSTVKPSGRFTILYFYEVDCPKCKLETAQLPYLIKEDFPVDFYPVYVGVDEAAWEKYRRDFPESGGRMRIFHLWDAEVRSDYQRKYGVLQTPRIFLVDPRGHIVGRGLDVATLIAMLQERLDGKKLQYGSEESVKVFDQTFEPYGAEIRGEDVRFVADHIARSTVEAADTLLFRQLTGDLLYYLIPKKGKAWKEGLEYVIDRQILSRPDVWKTADDSLKVVGTAQMMSELLSLAPVGSKVPALKLPGTLLKKGCKGIRSREGTFRLDALGGRRNLLLFWTEGCAYCKAEKAAAVRLLESKEGRGVRILEINMDELFSTDIELVDRLLSTFDLTAMPFIMETDRHGRVTGRYLSLTE